MRLIDVDKLTHALATNFVTGKRTLGQVIDEQPTAFDVAKEEVNEKAQELSSQAFFLSILNCNQIFPGLFSTFSVYGQNSVSGFLVSLKRIDGVLICFSG